MAQLRWQPPPFPGRVLHRFVPADSSYQIAHHAQVPALHEGRVSVLKLSGSAVCGGSYWSRYRFQVAPDTEDERGPWPLGVTFTIAAGVLKATISPGDVFGQLAARATVRRVSDGSILYNKLLRQEEQGRILGGSPLYDIDLDSFRVDADELQLDLFSYASAAVRAPAFSWPETKGLLELDTVGSGANVFITLL